MNNISHDRADQTIDELRQDVATLQAENAKIKSMLKETAHSNKIKSEFFTNMSHELRTPLNSVLGFVNLLYKTHLTPQQQDYVATMKNSASNLLTLINDVLDFSKIEAGKLRLDYAPMELRKTIDETLSLLAPSAHEKSLELVPFVYNDVPEIIICDQLRIRQILTNLIGNAIKFTDKGSIIVRVMLEEQTNPQNITLRFSITDTGIGIPEEEQAGLFEAFNQVQDNSATRNVIPGSGLGLAICRKLVEQMHGKIDLESAAGQGATFWFTITVNTLAPISKQIETLTKFNDTSVLLYENHPITKLVLLNLLESWNINVDTADDPNDIYNMLQHSYARRKPYDMLLLGINDLQEQRDLISNTIATATNSQSHCATGVLINSTEQNTHAEVINMGASFCLAKPICRKRLNNAIHNIATPIVKSAPIVTENTQQDTKLHILAVDDNPINIKLVAAILDNMKIKVTSALSGKEALELTHSNIYDLILMDLQMPEMDGIATTTAIRNYETQHNKAPTPIIALTAYSLNGKKEQLQAAGMNAHLMKPVNEHELQAIIYKWTENNSSTNNNEDKENIQQNNSANKQQQIAKELLPMLAESLPNDIAAIYQSYAELDFDQLKNHLHKLQGGCCYCNVPDLLNAVQLASQAVSDCPVDSEKVKNALKLLLVESQKVIQMTAIA